MTNPETMSTRPPITEDVEGAEPDGLEQDDSLDDGPTAGRIRWQRLLARPETGVGAGLIAAMTVFAIVAPRAFLTGDNVRNLALDNSTLAISAMALTLVMISGGLDLSGGSVIALTQVVTASSFTFLSKGDFAALSFISFLWSASSVLWLKPVPTWPI